ncbi:MAG: T9SS type A sorting domain-containing protein, partial [Chitinophagales bacterium]|nr:T9SS type A sorting domain-containing protein [Chitinophagales bacterium]
ILGFDDWLPTPSVNSTGENTFWSGYHEGYDFYNAENLIPATGVVKMYSQKRYIQSILWARKFDDADSNKVYLMGISAGGMGPYLTANLIPEKVTAAYCVAGNFKLVTIANDDTQPEQMWGTLATNLNSDVLNPETGVAIPVFSLFDIREMLAINKNQNMPLIFCVYGKNDQTIFWTSYTVSLSDSLEHNHIGGKFFWDQREHDGSGQNFNDAETMPDWYSYANNISYPAFSNCTINQDLGDGTPANGAAYGAINGYLDYTKDNVTDATCNITYKIKIIDLLVGGVPNPVQYNTCFADVTVRRAQNFHPSIGETIKWNNFDSSNAKIQNGSFVYNGGLITISGVQINKSGNRLDIKISNCAKEGDDEISETSLPEITFQNAGSAYLVSIKNLPDEVISLSVVNIIGETVLNKIISGKSGDCQFQLPQLSSGIYIISLRGTNFSLSKKLFASH